MEVGLKGSRVLGIASGWSGHGDKEVGRQEACCLGWDEDDLALDGIPHGRVRGFRRKRDVGSASSAAAVPSWLRKLPKMFW